MATTTSLIFGALALILSGFDAWLTKHRMIAYGPQVELNPVIRWLGPSRGAFFGLTSNFLYIFLFFLFSQPLLAFFAGLKTGLFVLQVRSLHGK